jgi:hypothetical protein
VRWTLNEDESEVARYATEGRQLAVFLWRNLPGGTLKALRETLEELRKY